MASFRMLRSQVLQILIRIPRTVTSQRRECCVGQDFGVPLQKPVKEAVAATPPGEKIDLGQLLDELDIMHSYAERTPTATSVVEKLHRVNQSLAKSKGIGKRRDLIMIQIA